MSRVLMNKLFPSEYGYFRSRHYKNDLFPSAGKVTGWTIWNENVLLGKCFLDFVFEEEKVNCVRALQQYSKFVFSSLSCPVHTYFLNNGSRKSWTECMYQVTGLNKQTKGIYSTDVTWIKRDTTETWIAYGNPHLAYELVLTEWSLITLTSAKGFHFPALVWPFTVSCSIVCAPPWAHYDYNVGWFGTSKEMINHEKQFSFRTRQSCLYKQLRSRLFCSFVFLWAQCDFWSRQRVQKSDILILISAILLI